MVATLPRIHVGNYTPPSRQAVRSLLGYEPTGSEQLAVLDSTGRYIGVSGGEQSGKSDVLAEVVTERTFELFKPGLIWMAGESYAETEKVFEYTLDKLDRLRVVRSATSGASNKYREIILIDSTKYKTLTVADTRKIGRERPDIIVVDEVAKTSLTAYYKLRARAAAGHGLLIMGGTFEGSYNWYPLKWSEWRGWIRGLQSVCDSVLG